MTAQQRLNIRYTQDGVAVVRMQDEETQNGLSESFCAELEEAFAQLACKSSVKVVVLEGGPRVFSSGATLEALERVSGGDFKIRDLRLPALIIGFPRPVISAVRGAAVGGGLVLAICADVSVASESQRYGFNFTDLGFTPGMGSTALVPQLTGASFAAEMLFTGKYYRGRELVGRGLFTHIVPDEQVEARAMELAQRMADKPRAVLQLLKETLARPRLRALEEALAHEHLMHQVSFEDSAAKQRIEDRYLRKTG